MNEEKDLFEKTFDELWKTEEYNFGTTDEDGWHNFDDYTEYPFAIEEMETLANEYNKIKQQLQAYKDKEKNMDDYIKELLEVNKDINNQLQAYKDKEDKLREYCLDKLTDIPFYRDDKIKDEYSHRLYKYMNEFLQILNEGE